MLGLLAQSDASWVEVLEILTFRSGWNAGVVLAGTTMLGVASGLIGTFSLLRNRALMGDALSHATLPGVCVMFMVLVSLGFSGRSVGWLLVGAATSGVLGVVTVQAITRYSRIREDAAIGIVLSVFFGVGVVLLSRIQSMQVGTQGGLNHFILGQTAGMSARDAMIMASVALLAMGSSAMLFKELRVLCFDRHFAHAQGWPVQWLDLALMALVVVVTVVGIQAVGMLLIVALLIIPPAAARFWTDRLGVMTILSGFIGGVSGYLGVVASSIWSDMPAGAVIVLASGAIFLLSFVVAPRRGVVARVVTHVRLRIRIACDHVMRLMQEALETSGGVDASASERVHLSQIERARVWSPTMLRLSLRALMLRGLLTRGDGYLELTPQGVDDAARVTRNHRLWERFLVTHADLAVSHVDRAADLVEHVLSPEMVARLEREVALEDGGPSGLPESVHEIAHEGGGPG
ncbi:MAG: metal ABC transporter permease [Planctomycetota bacterium]|jgi:manganese/zinc/iron transport system permease protein